MGKMLVIHKQRMLFTVALSLLTHYSSYYTPTPPFPFSVPSFHPSVPIRMGHVQVGRGRKRCPSAAACQRRRSAVLLTVSTPWWVSYCVTVYIKYKLWIHIHEIFNVKCIHQGFLCSIRGVWGWQTFKSLVRSEVDWAQHWNSVDDSFIYISVPGWGEWTEENSAQLTGLPALLLAGYRPPGSVLGAVQEGVWQSPDFSCFHTRGQYPQKKAF